MLIKFPIEEYVWACKDCGCTNFQVVLKSSTIEDIDRIECVKCNRSVFEEIK